VEALLRQHLEPLRDAAERRSPGEINATSSQEDRRARYGLHAAPPELAEHLSLVARWFYSKPREGEILFREAVWPYRRILRACGRLLAPEDSPPL
jgi:hypothetical protein